MTPAGNSWEERIERDRRLRNRLAAGDIAELTADARDLVVDAVGDWLSLEERHFAEVRRRLHRAMGNRSHQRLACHQGRGDGGP